MVKIVATRCHILRLKCPNSISAGAPPQTPLEELRYTTPPDLLAGFRGPTYKGRKRKEDRGWEWEGSERRRGQGREKGEGGREGGACGRGQKGGKGNGGDKSPAWSSQDLGSTASGDLPFLMFLLQ